MSPGSNDVNVTITDITQLVNVAIIENIVTDTVIVTVNNITSSIAVNVVETVQLVTANITVTDVTEVVTIDITNLGHKGDPGADGDSAYQVWLDLGNVGTQQDFMDSLRPFNITVGAVPPTTPDIGDLWIDTNI